MIVKKLNTIFIHIPKCAGSSIEMALVDAAGFKCNTLEELRDELKEQLKVFIYLPAYNVEEIQHVPATVYRYLDSSYDKYFKFAFVRNPYDRAVSEFHYKHNELEQKQSLDKSDIVSRRKLFETDLHWVESMLESEAFARQQQCESVEIKTPVRFKAFHFCLGCYVSGLLRFKRLVSMYQHGKFLASIPKVASMRFLPHQYQYHWLPQTYFINDKVDFIGRVENMAEDIEVVESRLNTRLNMSFLNVNNTKGIGDSYRDLYTDETIKLVNKLYREDFERFGYDFWA